MIVPNSAGSIKTYGLPFYLLVIIVGIILFNIYVFIGFTTQVWQIYHFQKEIHQKDQWIAKLIHEQKEVKPTLKRSYQIAAELTSLKAERERILRTWRSIQQKGGRNFAQTSRGAMVRVQPYTIKTFNDSPAVTDLGKLNENNEQLTQYIEEEHVSQSELLKDLAAYERRLDHTPSIWPVSSSITSWFGFRRHPVLGYFRQHTGVDLQASYGTPVHAAAGGVVEYSGWQGGYGRVIIINHGYGLETFYAHNSRLIVKVGQQVKKGQLVSYSGNSGTSTGPHLHFEVRQNGQPINPMSFLRN